MGQFDHLWYMFGGRLGPCCPEGACRPWVQSTWVQPQARSWGTASHALARRTGPVRVRHHQHTQTPAVRDCHCDFVCCLVRLTGEVSVHSGEIKLYVDAFMLAMFHIETWCRIIRF